MENLLISILSAKVLYSISHYTSAKGMWDTLQILYEKTNDIKDSKVNMFIEEFKLLCIESKKFVNSMQTRFQFFTMNLNSWWKVVHLLSHPSLPRTIIYDGILFLTVVIDTFCSSKYSYMQAHSSARVLTRAGIYNYIESDFWRRILSREPSLREISTHH